MASSAASLFRSRAKSTLRNFATVSSQASPSTPASSSASSSSSSWKPPIEPGTEPAYDEALKYISTQQSQLRQQITKLEKEVGKYQSGTDERRIAEAKLNSHIVASQINDPEIRWKFVNNKDASLSNPVFAYLREKTWRSSRLPRILERIRLMKVLPDAISHITPVVDLQISFGEGEGFHDHGGSGGNVLPGCFVEAGKTYEAPTVTATPFHAEERLYTLAMIDLDAPYEAEQRLGTFAHWLIHDVPLSLTKTNVDISKAKTELPYIAPHPQNGTKYHRYTIVLLEQTQPISLASPPKRAHFSLHTYAEKHYLKPAGIHFWRAEWSKESKSIISDIYTNILQTKEPIYAQMTPKKSNRM